MADIEARRASETASGDAKGPSAEAVTLRQAGVRSIAARDVIIRQGGAVRVEAEKVEVTQGGIVLATTKAMDVTAGAVVATVADAAKLDQSWAQVVVARESVNLDQAAGGLLVSKTAHARDSVIGLVLAREFRGEGVRVLLGTRAAFAFGAGLGAALGLLAFLRRRG